MVCPGKIRHHPQKKYTEDTNSQSPLIRRLPETVDVFIHPLRKLAELASLGIKSLHALRPKSAETKKNGTVNDVDCGRGGGLHVNVMLVAEGEDGYTLALASGEEGGRVLHAQADNRLSMSWLNRAVLGMKPFHVPLPEAAQTSNTEINQSWSRGQRAGTCNK